MFHHGFDIKKLNSIPLISVQLSFFFLIYINFVWFFKVVRQCAYPALKAGVSMHPSHTGVSKVVGEDESELLAAIKCPQLFMPAGNKIIINRIFCPHNLARQYLSDGY